MKFLQLKQAETAINDGRLDEAYQILENADIRSFAAGQKLIGRLTDAYVTRAKDHLEQNLLAEALSDCNKANKLGGSQPHTAALKMEITQAMQKNQTETVQRAARLAQAQNHLKNGQLSVCQQMLDDAEDADQDMLRYQVQSRKAECDSLIQKIEQALQNRDMTLVITILKDNRWQDKISWNPQLAALIGKIRLDIVAQMRQALQRGRIDQAQLLSEQSLPVMQDMLDFRELQRTIEKLAQARCAAQQCQPRQTAMLLKTLRPALEQATWLETAIQYADQAADAIDALHNGPLGLILNEKSIPGLTPAASRHPAKINEPVMDKSVVPAAGAAATADKLPARFVLQVDGVGSYLVFSQSRVTIGPLSAACRPDLGLMADASSAVAEIERMEEDYFISGQQPIQVNKKTTQKALLNDGDRIDLSGRLGLRFRKPNPASATALVDLTSARLPSADIRTVVLLDRELVLGPGSGAHVRQDSWPEQLVLGWRDGCLFCRSREVVTVQNKPLDRNNPLPMNTPIRVGSASFVITEYK